MNQNLAPFNNSRKNGFKLIDQFNNTYWSGKDLEIYANNILLDSVQLSVQVYERVQPYYGYASFVADRMHHGTRLISGELTLNFLRFTYLYSLLQATREQKPSDLWIPRPLKTQGPVPDTTVTNPIPYTNYAWGPQSATKIQTQEFTAEQAEKFVEAKKRARSSLAVDRSASVIQQNAGIFETSLAGFDLNVVFGGSLTNPIGLRLETDEDKYYADGSISPLPPRDPSVIGTGLKIVGVEIMNNNMVMGDEGRSMMETYSYIAKDIVPLTPQAIGSLTDKKRVMQAAVNEQTPAQRFSVPSSYGQNLPADTPTILSGGNVDQPPTRFDNP